MVFKSQRTFGDEGDKNWGSDAVQDTEPLVPVMVVLVGVDHRHRQSEQ